MAQSNKLTLAKLNAIDNKQNQQKTIYVTDEKYEVVICTHFRESAISKIIDEADKLARATITLETEGEDHIGIFVGLITTFMLKEFTDLPFPKKYTAEVLIQYAKKYLDTGINTEVMQSFPQNEIEKVWDRASKYAKLTRDITAQAIKDTMDELQNAD